MRGIVESPNSAPVTYLHDGPHAPAFAALVKLEVLRADEFLAWRADELPDHDHIEPDMDEWRDEHSPMDATELLATVAALARHSVSVLYASNAGRHAREEVERVTQPDEGDPELVARAKAIVRGVL
jgi:hypothetical protein